MTDRANEIMTGTTNAFLIRRSFAGLMTVIILMLCAAFYDDRAEAAIQAVAKMTLVEGTVDILKDGALPANSAKIGDAVYMKDIIRTKSASRAEVTFVDGTLLKVAQRSRIDISEYVVDDPSGKKIIKLQRGKVEAVVPPGSQRAAAGGQNRFEVHTPNAVAGVRGTDYVVFFDNDITWVYVKEGSVTITNPAFPDQVMTITAGEMAIVPLSQPPSKKDATEGDKKMMEQAAKTKPAKFASGLGGGSGVAGGTGGSAGSGGAGSSGSPVGAPAAVAGTAFESTASYSSDRVIINTVVPQPPPPTPPAVEVGRTTLSGSLVSGPAAQFDYISVTMKDVIFLAPSTGQAPTLWNTGSISGSYQFGPNITSGISSIPVSDGRGITGSFNITQWSNNYWSGSTSGSGSLSGGSYTGPVSFYGGVLGGYSGGSFTGTGSGTVTK